MIGRFGLLREFEGWDRASDLLQSLIAEHGLHSILELGSGKNPVLTSDYVRSQGLSYVASDVSAGELKGTDPAFARLVVNLCSDAVDPALDGKFDCIFSRMVAEHVDDGDRYHSNIYRLLKPGGISAQCFSTLWALPFTANYLLPEWLGDLALRTMDSSRNWKQNAKFRAHYSWSRGPSKKMCSRFEGLGFEVLRYDGYFGHPYYRHFPWLDRLEAMKSEWLVRHPVSSLCSYATIVLRKPLKA